MTRDEAVRFAFAELHQTFFDALHALMAKVDARARAQERDKVGDLLMDVREQLAVYAKAIMDKDAEIERLRDMLIIVSQWIDKDPAYSELHQRVLSAIRARGEKP